jgi:DNA processing protein
VKLTNNELREKLTEVVALLSIPGIGRGRYHALVKHFGAPKAVLKATVSQLERVSGISHKIANDIQTNKDSIAAREIASKIIQLGWTTLLSDDILFPAILKTISASDVPPVLFKIGAELSESDKMIAIVGARHATEQGKRIAYNLSFALAQAGITVVSGMAEGIDSAAHKGALDAGGKTVAVLGNSLDIVYPPSNKELAKRILENGVLLSEYFPGTRPDRSNFPERNRIISGLSDGVVVVEAGKKSGALLTASQALLQGRTLFAVPGSPTSKMSEGANLLIKKGARLLTSIDDVYEELPLLKGEVMSKQFSQLPDMTNSEREIIKLFSEGPQQVDNISRSTNLPVSELMEFLLALELKGILREISGKRYELSEEYSYD